MKWVKKNNRIKIVTIIAFLLSIGPLTWIVYGNGEKDIAYSIQEEQLAEGTEVKLTVEILPSDKVVEISKVVLPDESIIENQTRINYQVQENGEYKFVVLYKIVEEDNHESKEIEKEETITYQVESIKKEKEVVEEMPKEEELEEKSLKAVNEEGIESIKEFPEVYATGDIEINETTFPDENFRNWVLSQSYGADKKLTSAEISTITNIDVSRQNIVDLKGIEHFTSLNVLDCYRNQLKNLDVTKNTLLTKLNCSINQIVSLDVRPHKMLTYLYCNSNQLTELNVTNNTGLKILYSSGNNLKNLDVTKNTALETLYCHTTPLTELNVKSNTALKDLRCYGDKLSNLDVSNNTKLEILHCYSNNIMTLDLSKNNNLIELELDKQSIDIPMIYSNNTWKSDANIKYKVGSIENSKVNYNATTGQFTISSTTATSSMFSSDCKDGTGTVRKVEGTLNFIFDVIAIDEYNFPDKNFREWILSQSYGTDKKLMSNEITNITTIDVGKPKEALDEEKISSLKGIEYFTSLATLQCYNNKLTELDIRNNTNLRSLYCYTNSLSSIDVSQNILLSILHCAMNNLSSLDIRSNTSLVSISCYTNKLTELDVSNNPKLITLQCHNNAIQELDISNCIALKIINCSNNNLTRLDVSNNAQLTQLLCYNNQLIKLDFGNNTALTELNCSKNYLTELNIEQSVNLLNLLCNDNKEMTTINVSNNTVLEKLNCSNCSLEQLYVQNNTLLKELYCNGNQLTAIDVTRNTALITLYTSRNPQLSELDIRNNDLLVTLYCGASLLTELDISNNKNLENLRCNDNQLTKLDLSNNALLKELECFNNQIINIDFSVQKNLVSFVGDSQKISIPMMKINAKWQSNSSIKYELGSIEDKNISYDSVTGQFTTTNTIPKSSGFTTDCVDGNGTTRQVSGTLNFTYEGFIPVSNIKDVPKTIQVGQIVTLAGTVEPSNATEKDIVWSIKDVGTTGAIVTDNNLTVQANGTLILTATVLGGLESGDYTQDFTVVTLTEPSTLVSIPSNIQLKKERNDEQFEAVKEEEVSILPTTDTTVFTENFYIQTEPSFHLINTTNSDEWFTAQVYDEGNNKHTSKDTPLAILNSTTKKKSFFVKTWKDITREKGIYEGTMNFIIGYGDRK